MRASLNFTLPEQEQEFQAALDGLRNGTLSAGETAQLRAEIERLRSQPCPYVAGAVTRYCTLTPLALTDAERAAVKAAADAYADNDDDADCERMAATLRGLLERLSPAAT